MTPTAAQITEAQRIINQVGVPTDKVVMDVAQLIADADSMRNDLAKLNDSEIKWIYGKNQPTPAQLDSLADLMRWHGVTHISMVPGYGQGEMERPPGNAPRDKDGWLLPKTSVAQSVPR